MARDEQHLRLPASRASIEDMLGAVTVDRLPTPVPFHSFANFAQQQDVPRSTSPTPATTPALPSPPIPTPTKSKTLSFFSNPLPKLKPAPPEIRVPILVTSPESTTDSSATKSNGTSSGAHTATTSAAGTGSANDSFFFSPPSFNRPTPPPSITSDRSSETGHDLDDEDSAVAKKKRATLPPLSRFFPSRHSRTTSASSREFVDLDTGTGSGERDTFYSHSNPGSSHGHGTLPESEYEYEQEASFDASPLSSPTSSSLNHNHNHNHNHSPPTPPPKDYPPLPLLSPTNLSDLPPLEPNGIFTLPTNAPPELGSGARSEPYTLTLIRPLGQGSFSTVWLAKDTIGTLTRRRSGRKVVATRNRNGTRSRARTGDGVDGLRPGEEWPRPHPDGEDETENQVEGEEDWVAPLPASGEGVGRNVSIVLRERDGEGASISSTTPPQNADESDLVALKLIPISLCRQSVSVSPTGLPHTEDHPTRVSIAHLREVSILSRISHPSIISFLGSFTTSHWHVLCLPYISGGELWELLNDDVNYTNMTEELLRRIWTELVRAVGWCHGVGLVHRDVKLENVLLTTNAFLNPTSLPPLSTPLIKLTDFNLARFIDPSSPLLTTKCGSESYAAPEIVLGKPYDGRETDAWACGVVLYGMCCRRLPFGSPPEVPALDPTLDDRSSISTRGSGSLRRKGREEKRRDELLRIARGEYSFPQFSSSSSSSSASSSGELLRVDLITPSLEQVVGRLLVRDPAKRARLLDIWDEEWMKGKGAVERPVGAA